MDGFVVLDKPPGVTSFKASAGLRRIYGEKKTGHTGTLDPMATGVLPVALGRATRFIDYLPGDRKGYSAGLKTGLTTDTLDITGETVTESGIRATREQLLAVLDSFRGDIMQLPPMYSALSKDGVKLYKLARKGIEVERDERPVKIYSLELTGGDDGEFTLDVVCSKGTYIRSLIADIGEKLGSGAVMTKLRRTLSNGFTLENAYLPDDIAQAGEKAVIPVERALSRYAGLELSAPQSARFSNGGGIFADRVRSFEGGEGLYRMFSPDGVFLGLGEYIEDGSGEIKVKKVFAAK